MPLLDTTPGGFGFTARPEKDVPVAMPSFTLFFTAVFPGGRPRMFPTNSVAPVRPFRIAIRASTCHVADCKNSAKQIAAQPGGADHQTTLRKDRYHFFSITCKRGKWNRDLMLKSVRVVKRYYGAPAIISEGFAQD